MTFSGTLPSRGLQQAVLRERFSVVSWIGMLLFVSGVAVNLSAAAAQDLPLHEDAKIRGIEVSADGKRVLFDTCLDEPRISPDDSGKFTCDLHQITVDSDGDMSSDEIISHESTDAEFAADGQRIAYISACGDRACLHVFDGERTTALGPVGSSVLEWLSPDSLIVAVPASDVGVPNGIESFSDGSRLISSSGSRDGRAFRGLVRLESLQIDSGARHVISEPLPIVQKHPMIAVAPRMRRVAYTKATSGPPLVGAGGKADLLVWDVATDHPTTIAHNVRFPSAFDMPVWSPGGNRLAWCQYGDDDRIAIAVYDFAEDRSIDIAAPDGALLCPKQRINHLPILGWADDDILVAPVDDRPSRSWLDSEPRSLRKVDLQSGKWSVVANAAKEHWIQLLQVQNVSGDPVSYIASVGRGGLTSIEQLRATTRQVLLRDILVSTSTTELAASADGRQLVYGHFDEFGSASLRSVRMRGNSATSTTLFSSKKSGKEDRWRTTWLTYNAAGSEQAAVLVSPRTTPKARRLIVNIYPSISVAQHLSSASGWPYPGLRYWLERGYSVYFPELAVRSGSVRDDIVAGATAALEAVHRTAQEDQQPFCSVFFVGQSFGGYANYVLSAADLDVDGAVIDAGMPSWNASFGDLFETGRPYGNLFAATPNIGPGGTPWTNPEGYRHASPYYDLDKVNIPILIGHGTDDQMDKFLAEMGYSALEALGKDVTMFMARGGRHGPGTFTIDQQKIFLGAMNQFFDKHSGKCDRSRHQHQSVH